MEREAEPDPPPAEGVADAEQSDAALVARARLDDAAAFAVLVRRHYGAVYAVALAVLGDRADAEDVCHDAFVLAAARLEECRHPDRFVHWLTTIARNRARNVLTRVNRRRATLDDAVAPRRDDAAQRVELAELRSRLEGALALLTPAQREVLLLHDLEGWTHDRIADVIGTSSGMSRQHLFKAHRRLREALGDQLFEDYRP